MRIAIIGTGISGLTAAYILQRKHDITVYESAGRIGGHTATIKFELDNKPYAIDTGFIVFNDWTYPNFIQLLEQLGVDSLDTSMGFSVSCEKTGIEYAGKNLNTVFAQRRNIFSPYFLRMTKDILRFNKEALADLDQDNIASHITLGEYLKKNGYSQQFAEYYLIPMGAAIWSMSCERIYAFPLRFFVAFFKNHGLLNLKDRPTWRVIKGGSSAYLPALTSSFTDKIKLNSDIKAIERTSDTVVIHHSNGESEHYDEVVIATHSDQALKLLSDPSQQEKEVLGGIPYEDNSVILHYDDTLLPKNKKTWSSWNYKLRETNNRQPTLTYNMNILQGLRDKKTFCVTLNDDQYITPDKIIGKYTYAHPQFTLAGEKTKKKWNTINGVNRTWFCGAYWGNGFHEDGVVSALRVAEGYKLKL